MAKFSLFVFFAIVHFQYGNFIKAKPKHIPRYVFGRPYGGFLNQPRPGEEENLDECQPNSFEEGWLTQPVDHFDLMNTATFQEILYSCSCELLFNMASCKWICNPNYSWTTWAKEYGAALFQAEHRYFGKSRPRPDQSVLNLKWFTPEQILADYHNFIQQMNQKFFSNVTNPRWVLFGGSYPGSLTAWMRATYPNVSIGGVSSSSAVGLFVDYYGYATNMQTNYNANDPNCANNIKAAFTQMQSLVYSETGRELLEVVFNLCDKFPSTDTVGPKDIQFFFSNIFGVFQGINQYTGDNRDNATASTLGIPMACQIMNNSTETDPIKRVKNVIDWSNLFYDPNAASECLSNSYSQYIWAYQQSGYDDATGDEIAAGRSWIWQTCTYLGYFQTTDGGHDNSIWGSLLPMDFYVDQCIELFSPQYNADFTFASVQKYLQKFGGASNYKGTNVVFPNGSYDPWKSLGLLPGDDNQANNVTAIFIDRGAHCSDMYPARSTDHPELTAARNNIHRLLDGFIRASATDHRQTGSSTTTTGLSSLSSQATPEVTKNFRPTTSSFLKNEENFLFIVLFIFISNIFIQQT